MHHRRAGAAVVAQATAQIPPDQAVSPTFRRRQAELMRIYNECVDKPIAAARTDGLKFSIQHKGGCLWLLATVAKGLVNANAY